MQKELKLSLLSGNCIRTKSKPLHRNTEFDSADNKICEILLSEYCDISDISVNVILNMLNHFGVIVLKQYQVYPVEYVFWECGSCNEIFQVKMLHGNCSNKLFAHLGITQDICRKFYIGGLQKFGFTDYVGRNTIYLFDIISRSTYPDKDFAGFVITSDGNIPTPDSTKLNILYSSSSNCAICDDIFVEYKYLSQVRINHVQKHLMEIIESLNLGCVAAGKRSDDIKLNENLNAQITNIREN